MSPSLCPASNCSMRSLTLAAMTSFAACALGVDGSVADVGFSGAVHGVLLSFALAFARCMRGMYLHAERLLAKAGVASCKGRGIPTLEDEAKPERKGRSAAEVCTSEARKTGETPCGARSGQSP